MPACLRTGMHTCMYARYCRHSIMPVLLTLHYMINVSRLKSNGCTKTSGLNNSRVSGMLKVGNGMSKAGANLVLIHSHLLRERRKPASNPVCLPCQRNNPHIPPHTHNHSYCTHPTTFGCTIAERSMMGEGWAFCVPS